jgi:hypothetical protein
VEVHLVDGTYELFRHYYGAPEHFDPDGVDVGAVRGVLRSIVGMLEEGATHVGVATDHIIESYRNDLYDDYKTGEGVPSFSPSSRCSKRRCARSALRSGPWKSWRPTTDLRPPPRSPVRMPA